MLIYFYKLWQYTGRKQTIVTRGIPEKIFHEAFRYYGKTIHPRWKLFPNTLDIRVPYP